RPGGAVRADEAERGAGDVRGVAGPVRVAHAGAVRVAVLSGQRLVLVEAGAVGGHPAALVRGLEEAVADARGAQAVDAGDVSVRLARVRQRPAGVVVVERVAPLVVEDGRDLARVAATAARAEEVDRPVR